MQQLWESATQSNAPADKQICTRSLYTHIEYKREVDGVKSLTHSFPIQSLIYSQAAALICGPMDALCVCVALHTHTMHRLGASAEAIWIFESAAACATDWCILCLALGAFFAVYGERSRRRAYTTTEPQFPSRSINFTEFHDSSLCLMSRTLL